MHPGCTADCDQGIYSTKWGILVRVHKARSDAQQNEIGKTNLGLISEVILYGKNRNINSRLPLLQKVSFSGVKCPRTPRPLCGYGRQHTIWIRLNWGHFLTKQRNPGYSPDKGASVFRLPAKGLYYNRSSCNGAHSFHSTMPVRTPSLPSLPISRFGGISSWIIIKEKYHEEA